MKEFIVRLSGEYSIPGDARPGFREQSLPCALPTFAGNYPLVIPFQLSIAYGIHYSDIPTRSRCKFTPRFYHRLLSSELQTSVQVPSASIYRFNRLKLSKEAL